MILSNPRIIINPQQIIVIQDCGRQCVGKQARLAHLGKLLDQVTRIRHP
jgi:hypothetical protein